jgi:hypothetical protein
MADDEAHGADAEGHAEAATDSPYPNPPERSTAPQSDYTMRDVGVGFVVMVVGVVVTFGLPLLL